MKIKETQRGWWTLKIEGIDGPVSDATLEHIAQCIIDGCHQGEVIEEPDEECEE